MCDKVFHITIYELYIIDTSNIHLVKFVTKESEESDDSIIIGNYNSNT